MGQPGSRYEGPLGAQGARRPKGSDAEAAATARIALGLPAGVTDEGFPAVKAAAASHLRMRDEGLQRDIQANPNGMLGNPWMGKRDQKGTCKAWELLGMPVIWRRQAVRPGARHPPPKCVAVAVEGLGWLCANRLIANALLRPYLGSLGAPRHWLAPGHGRPGSAAVAHELWYKQQWAVGQRRGPKSQKPGARSMPESRGSHSATSQIRQSGRRWPRPDRSASCRGQRGLAGWLWHMRRTCR